MPSGANSPREPRLGRREFLTLAAGGAAAGWLGLRPGFGPARGRVIAGSIVGASQAAGHRLRGGPMPTPAERRDVPIVIAGGGIAGLSAAWKLDKAGCTGFELFELEPEPGGNARWGESDVTAYPWGAHYLPVPTTQSRAVRELLEELGVIEGYCEGTPVYDQRYLCHAPQERLFIHGRWQEGLFPHSGMPPEEAAQVAAFRERMRQYRDWHDAAGRRAFAIPMELSSAAPDIRALDRVSMKDWLDLQGWSSPRLRWYVNYCCRDDYGCTIGDTSAWAGIHYFCAREIEDAPVLTWPEGNGWIARRLAARLGDRVRTNALVYRIERGADGGALVDVLDTRTGRSTRLRARHVIYALPRFTAAHVIAGYAAAGAREFTYAPWLVANVTVDRPPSGAAWDNVIFDSTSLGYVVATHQALSTRPGASVLTYYHAFAGSDPAAARTELLVQPWEHWRDRVLADLRRAHPRIEESVRRIDVMLWGHAMIRPTPGFVWGAARRAAAEPFGPVLFAHSDMSGLSLFEEAQYRGVAAAEAVLRRMGKTVVSSLEG